MKFFRLVFLVLICSLGFSTICFADDSSGSAIEESSSVFSEVSTSGGITVIVNNPGALSSSSDSSFDIDDISVGNLPQAIYDDMRLMSVSTSSERISSTDANGFKAVVLGLIGDYETVITDYTYQSSSGYSSHSIDITPDYSWIASASIFLVVIFCAFRIVGGILCNR